MSIFTLYVLFVLLPAIHALKTGFIVIGIMSGLCAAALFMVWVVESQTKWKEMSQTLFKWVTVPALLLSMLVGFSPTEKQVAILIGGYTVTNVEGIEKLPKSIVDAIDGYLKQFDVPEKVSK